MLQNRASLYTLCTFCVFQNDFYFSNIQISDFLPPSAPVDCAKVDKHSGRSSSHVPKPYKSPDEEQMDDNSACSSNSLAISMSQV